VTRTSPQAGVDGTTGQEPAESPDQDQTTAEDDEVKTTKLTRLSSRERSCSSDRAASTILEPAAAEQVGLIATEKPAEVSKEKKPEKRPSATRRSLSRRVKRQCPPRDISPFLKPQLSQEESVISLDSDSQDSLKGEPASKPIEAGQDPQLPSKRPRTTKDDDDIDQGEDDALRESEAVDEKLAIVPAPEVLNFRESEAPGVPTAEIEVGVGWSEMEMGLYEKGLQIFGRNRYVPLLLCYKCWS